MAESATLSRSGTRRDTTVEIIAAAQRLTDERGLDGFTMDDLADEVGVSRRTLFNHVPGKIDAVLGPDLTVDAPAFRCSPRAGRRGSCSTMSAHSASDCWACTTPTRTR